MSILFKKRNLFDVFRYVEATSFDEDRQVALPRLGRSCVKAAGTLAEPRTVTSLSFSPVGTTVVLQDILNMGFD